jgi:hypothetical protein
MQKRLVTLFAVSVTMVALMISAGGAKAKHYGASASERHHGVVNSCNDLDFEFEDHQALREEDHFTVPKSATALEVQASRNGGIEVMGWNGNDYSITACKAAVENDLLKEISVSVTGGHVTANGPGDGEWTVYLIVKAPKDSNLSLKANNGPIGLRDVSGRIKALSKNGPISVKDCVGEVEANTENGPISLSGSSGNLKLDTRNGPISVALAGSKWEAGGVTAHTENGPLSLEVPENYMSGVRVEMSGHSPVSCHAAQCSKSSRTWDDNDRYIEFGGATPVIRMSTVNGPVSVDSGTGDL